jgi:hypothetical protein
MASHPPSIHRTISYALRVAREREESETLLGDEELSVDASGCVTETRPGGVHHNPHAPLPVYKNIHRYRQENQIHISA